MPGFRRFQIYVLDFLEVETIDLTKGDFYYRLGYCPVVVENEFAIAKTLLFPGYTGTPEFKLINESDLPRRQKERFLELSTSNDASNVVYDGDSDLIKWFHKNGVPQVIQTRRKIFDSSTSTANNSP